MHNPETVATQVTGWRQTPKKHRIMNFLLQFLFLQLRYCSLKKN